MRKGNWRAGRLSGWMLGLASVVTVAAATGCTPEENLADDLPDINVPTDDAREVFVRFRTTAGDITVAVNTVQTARTAANFLQYVEDDFYDNTLFHRIVQDDIFIVQGGGFDLSGEQKQTRAPIPLEIVDDLRNRRGTIAMARTNNPDSATSQFYFNNQDNPGLDAENNPPGFAVFGRVVGGLDVIDAIATRPTENQGGAFGQRPIEDIIIISAEIVPEP